MKHTPNLLAVAGAALVSVSHAQTSAVLPPRLDEVTVTATRMAQPVSDVPVSVVVVPLNEAFSGSIFGLRDLSRYEAGLSAPVQYGGTGNAPRNFPGARSINIRGIDGNRVLMQVDGIRLPEQFTFGGAQLIGRESVEPALYRTAEILKGSASALYGSDAVGGVLTFLSPRPSDLLGNGADARAWAGSLSGSVESSREETAVIGSIAGRSGPLSALVTAVRRDFTEPHTKGDFPADPFDTNSNAALVRIDYDLGDAGLLFLVAEALNRNTDGSNPSLAAVPPAQGGTPTVSQFGEQTVDRQRLQLGHDLVREEGYLRRLETRLYLQNAVTEEHFDTTQLVTAGPPGSQPQRRLRVRDGDFRNESLGGSVQVESRAELAGMVHRVVWGLDGSITDQERNEDFSQFNANTGALIDKVFFGELFPVKRVPDAEVLRYGFFAQDEITLDDAERWVLTPGLRLDRYDLATEDDPLFRRLSRDQAPVSYDSWALSPKLGLLYRAGENFAWFGQYHRGFRTPTNEDLNGAIYGRAPFGPTIIEYRTLPNPDLDSETSDSFEVGFRHRFEGASYQATVFYNSYSNFIETFAFIGGGFSGANPGLFQSRNLDSASVYGGELKLDIPLGHYVEALKGLNWTNSLAYARGEDEDSGQPLNSIDPLKWVSSLTYDSAGKWGVRVLLTVQDKQDRVDFTRLPAQQTIPGPNRPVQFVPPAYATVDLAAYWQVLERLRLSAGIFNLFDQKLWLWQDVRDLDRSRPDLDRFTQPGISGRISATVSF